MVTEVNGTLRSERGGVTWKKGANKGFVFESATTEAGTQLDLSELNPMGNWEWY